MVYITNTSNLPRAFLEWGSFSIRRTDKTISQMSIDMEGSVHMQAGRLFVDMCANRRKVLKTVQLTSDFFDANKGLAEHLRGTKMIVEDQIGDTWADAWALFAPRDEPEPTSTVEPEPTVEPTPTIEPEPTTEPEPKVEPEPTAEPEPEPKVKEEPESVTPKEPVTPQTNNTRASSEPPATASTFSWWG